MQTLNARQADDLVWERSQPFFSSSDWYELYARQIHAQRGESMRMLGGAASNHSVHRLPCIVETDYKLGLQGKRLRSLSNYYTPLYAGQCGKGHALATANEIASLVTTELESDRFTCLQFDPLEQSGIIHEGLMMGMRANGWQCFQTDAFVNWYHPVGDCFEAYYAARPSRVRNTFERKRRRFDSMAGSDIQIITNSALLEQHISEFEQVYACSWKQAEPYPEFMAELMRLGARREELRLGIARLDGKPIAAHLWIVSAGVASIYKLCYDESFRALSAGTLLMVDLLQHVIDIDKVHEIDFLSGDDPYKQDWMSHRRVRVRLDGFNPKTLYGQAATIRTRLRQWFP